MRWRNSLYGSGSRTPIGAWTEVGSFPQQILIPKSFLKKRVVTAERERATANDRRLCGSDCFCGTLLLSGTSRSFFPSPDCTYRRSTHVEVPKHSSYSLRNVRPGSCAEANCTITVEV